MRSLQQMSLILGILYLTAVYPRDTVTYLMWFTTANEEDAGAKNWVYIQFTGEKGLSGTAYMNDYDWKKGVTNYVSADLDDVGKLKKLTLRTQADSDQKWKLDKVYVRIAGRDDESYTFIFNHWFAGTDGFTITLPDITTTKKPVVVTTKYITCKSWIILTSMGEVDIARSHSGSTNRPGMMVTIACDMNRGYEACGHTKTYTLTCGSNSKWTGKPVDGLRCKKSCPTPAPPPSRKVVTDVGTRPAPPTTHKPSTSTHPTSTPSTIAVIAPTATSQSHTVWYILVILGALFLLCLIALGLAGSAQAQKKRKRRRHASRSRSSGRSVSAKHTL